MTGFNDREKAFEGKFIHDEEKAFKIHARRRKFLGLWAGEQMHLPEEEDLQYALEVVKFGVGAKSREEVAAKVHADMQAAGIEITLEEVHDKMVQLTDKAVKSLEKDGEI
jgi:hypothetical protein